MDEGIVKGTRTMKFSIIVPTWNSEKYLDECLSSIQMQGHDTGIIVVDGGSTDNTLKICGQYHRNLRIIQREPHGEPDAINTGMKEAIGEIVAYIDSDDRYEMNCFDHVSRYFTLHPECQWLYGKGKVIDGNGKETHGIVTFAKERLQPHYSYSALLCCDFVVQPTVFMRREFFNQVGNFNISQRLVFDYEYWLRAGIASKPGFINKYLASWRAHENSISVKQYKEEARDAYDVQKTFNDKGVFVDVLRYLVYRGTVGLYSVMNNRKENI